MIKAFYILSIPFIFYLNIKLLNYLFVDSSVLIGSIFQVVMVFAIKEAMDRWTDE